MIIIKDLAIFDAAKTRLILTIPELKITEKSFCLIQGNSGSGKTMLLKTIANQHQFFAGNILIKERIYESYTDNELPLLIQFLDQSYSLFSHFTAEEQLMHPLLHIKKFTQKTAQEKISHYLHILKMEEHIKKFPSQLSGGQRQRLALIQKLIMDPEILLLDEPTSGLDKKSKQIVMNLLQEEIKKKSTTILITSHDPEIINSHHITQKFNII